MKECVDGRPRLRASSDRRLDAVLRHQLGLGWHDRALRDDRSAIAAEPERRRDDPRPSPVGGTLLARELAACPPPLRPRASEQQCESSREAPGGIRLLAVPILDERQAQRHLARPRIAPRRPQAWRGKHLRAADVRIGRVVDLRLLTPFANGFEHEGQAHCPRKRGSRGPAVTDVAAQDVAEVPVLRARGCELVDRARTQGDVAKRRCCRHAEQRVDRATAELMVWFEAFVANTSPARPIA